MCGTFDLGGPTKKGTRSSIADQPRANGSNADCILFVCSGNITTTPRDPIENTWEAKTMVSDDKQFEYVTSQIIKHVERSVDAFKMFAQLSSAIVGGSIW